MMGVPMIRTFAILALSTVGFALPAMAAEGQKFDPAQTAAFSAELTNAAKAQQARLQLAQQGYTNISPLDRDETGRWVGTAMKDGKKVFVGVILPVAPHQTQFN